jgi:hypothetical protein
LTCWDCYQTGQAFCHYAKLATILICTDPSWKRKLVSSRTAGSPSERAVSCFEMCTIHSEGFGETRIWASNTRDLLNTRLRTSELNGPPGTFAAVPNNQSVFVEHFEIRNMVFQYLGLSGLTSNHYSYAESISVEPLNIYRITGSATENPSASIDAGNAPFLKVEQS